MVPPAESAVTFDNRQPQARESARSVRVPRRVQAQLIAPVQKIRRVPENKHDPLISCERVLREYSTRLTLLRLSRRLRDAQLRARPLQPFSCGKCWLNAGSTSRERRPKSDGYRYSAEDRICNLRSRGGGAVDLN